MEKEVDVSVVFSPKDEVGLIGVVKNDSDIKKLKDDLVNLALDNNKEIRVEDIDIISRKIIVSKQHYNFSLIESISQEVIANISIKLDRENAQKLVDLSKRIPRYTEDDLYYSLSLFNAKVDKTSEMRLFW